MKKLSFLFSFFAGVVVLISSCVKEVQTLSDQSILLIYNNVTVVTGMTKLLTTKITQPLILSGHHRTQLLQT